MPLTQEEKEFAVGVMKDIFGEVFKETLAVVRDEIKQTEVSPAVGMLGVGHFNDLLHGGAFTVSIDKLPYYNPEVQAQLKLVGAESALSLVSPTVVDLTPWGLGKIALPQGAKPEQIETLLNSNAPRRFPKILSDQECFLNKEWRSLFFTQNLATGIVSNITTLVKTGAEAESATVGSLAGLIKAAKPEK